MQAIHLEDPERIVSWCETDHKRTDFDIHIPYRMFTESNFLISKQPKLINV